MNSQAFIDGQNLDRGLYADLSARDVKRRIEYKKGRKESKKRDTA